MEPVTVLFQDLSDNNSQRTSFSGFAGVILKLYPSGSSGFAWLKTQHAAALAWQAAHPGFIIGFYAADSTPTWSSAKSAADALGVDLNAGPFAFDLREFGYSRDHVAAQVTAAHAAGQHKVGEYYRDADTGDWHWKANYVGTPAEPWLLHQFTDKPEDQSQPHAGVTAADVLAATTLGDDVAQFTDAQAAELKAFADSSGGGETAGFIEGMMDFVQGKARDTKKGDYYQRGYDLASGKGASSAGASATHTHANSTTGPPLG